MEPTLTPELVLSARSALPKLSLDVDNNLFRSTWLASHVRLVELVPNSSSSLALLVAHALTRNPRFDYPLDEWLPNTQFLPADAEAVTTLVKHAISDMKEEDRWPNDTLSFALENLPIDAEFIFDIAAGLEKQRPCSPYHYGPTYQMIWGKPDRVFFLQVHNES
jgi:hypothetical protein